MELFLQPGHRHREKRGRCFTAEESPSRKLGVNQEKCVLTKEAAASTTPPHSSVKIAAETELSQVNDSKTNQTGKGVVVLKTRGLQLTQVKWKKVGLDQVD